jgi:hypothetical protein
MMAAKILTALLPTRIKPISLSGLAKSFAALRAPALFCADDEVDIGLVPSFRFLSRKKMQRATTKLQGLPTALTGLNFARKNSINFKDDYVELLLWIWQLSFTYLKTK